MTELTVEKERTKERGGMSEQLSSLGPERIGYL